MGTFDSPIYASMILLVFKTFSVNDVLHLTARMYVRANGYHSRLIGSIVG